MSGIVRASAQRRLAADTCTEEQAHAHVHTAADWIAVAGSARGGAAARVLRCGDRARPAAARGTQVRFRVTARGGKGGPSDEVVAVSPELGRLVWLRSTGDDTYQADFTIPAGTRPGEYRFVFIAASNECYDNSTFPMLTLRIG